MAARPSFYVLTLDGHRSRYDAEVEEVEPLNLGEPARCPRCGGVIGMMTWLPPYRLELVLRGETFGDFIQETGNDLIVSERFARAFQAEGLTGLMGFHPVEVLRVRRKRRGGHSVEVPRCLIVTPRIDSAALDMEHSRIHYNELPTCAECLYGTKDAVHGFALDPKTWNGDDIFRPRGLFGFPVVSERFERFLEKHKFTNVHLTPTEEYVWNPLNLSP